MVGGLAKDWFDVEGAAVEPSTRDRHLENIRQLSRSFGHLMAGNITLRHVERWAVQRTHCSTNTFNKELEVLRGSQINVVEKRACASPRIAAFSFFYSQPSTESLSIP